MCSLKNTERAWAAGFFDGEGNANFDRGKKVAIQIAKIDVEVLERFRKAVGGIGTIGGPYTPKTKNSKPYWQYRVVNFPEAQQVMIHLWDYLSGIKQEQFRNTMHAYVQWYRSKPPYAYKLCQAAGHRIGINKRGSHWCKDAFKGHHKIGVMLSK